MPKRTPGAGPEQFVRTWQSSSSIEQVASSLGMSAHAVFMRADRYRKAGIPLRRFKRPGIDVERLTSVAVESISQPSTDNHTDITSQSQANRMRMVKC